MNELFHRIAVKVSNVAGSSKAFLAALIIIVVWAFSGPVFGYSDTWQLVINTATTIVTFLMVFLIQNTQNRESKAVQLKLNELIKAQRGARNDFIDLEALTDEELDHLGGDFRKMQEIGSHKILDKIRTQIEEEHQRRKRHGVLSRNGKA